MEKKEPNNMASFDHLIIDRNDKNVDQSTFTEKLRIFQRNAER